MPTLILQGSEDPVFPWDHGQMLAEIIQHAIYIPVRGMGHLPNRQFYDLIIDNIQLLEKRPYIGALL